MTAFDQGVAIPGRRSLEKDHCFPLKTILLHHAGILRRGGTVPLKKVPEAEELLRLCEEGVIKPDQEVEALRAHFTLVRDMALEKARSASLIIKLIVLTYPYYLEGDSIDFEDYLSSYLNLARPLWDGHDVSFESMSEGQAATIYLCEPFQDPAGSFDSRRLAEVLRGLQEEAPCGLNLVVADGGSSSLVCACQR